VKKILAFANKALYILGANSSTPFLRLREVPFAVEVAQPNQQRSNPPRFFRSESSFRKGKKLVVQGLRLNREGELWKL
jgi:hypothetical protein